MKQIIGKKMLEDSLLKYIFHNKINNFDQEITTEHFL